MQIRVFFLLIIFTSCSSLKKTVSLSALGGSVVGGMGGSVFSPDKGSQNRNIFIFSILGAGLFSGISYLIYKDPPREKKMTPLKIEVKEDSIFDFSPDLKKYPTKIDFKPISKYQVPLKMLPKNLEGKVKKQYLIEYQSKARTIKMGGRTFEIGPFKAWEHVYEE